MNDKISYRIIEGFILAIETTGHKSASNFFNISLVNFGCFCSISFYDNEDNFNKLLKDETQGCFLYNNNQEFAERFKTFLNGRIINEFSITSNLFNNSVIKILIIKVKEDEFRLVYEMNSGDRLSFV